MWISDISVKYPVLAIVFSLLLIVFGLVALDRLALREYPDVNPPIVSIETSYPGAAAHTVETRITKPIEDQVSGIEGIKTITAKSIDGLSTITIVFNINRNIDSAANDVRERVSQIVNRLPDAADAPKIFKVDANNFVMMWLNLTSDKMNTLQLTDYARRYLVDQLSVLKGVARVRIGGEKRYAMRIWLDRRAMAAKKVTVSDIEAALRANNIELPAGRLEARTRELSIRIRRQYQTPADFAKMVIRRDASGHLLTLGEVARVELGAQKRRTELRGNGINMIGLGIIKQSRANTLDVARAVKKEVTLLQKTLPKGMRFVQSYDSSVFIEAAIYEVYKTFFIALVMVLIVIFIFLGTLRTVIVPAVTVPISILATFIVLHWLNYSLNLLTLLALILAIGLVVDDAIVVVENIMRRIRLGEAPLLASYRGVRQVAFAVVATTMVLLAVFLPIALLRGNVGRLFSEFAFAISSAVVFSSIIALTLSPVMCAALLKPHSKEKRLEHLSEQTISWLARYYRASLKWCMRYQWLVVVIFILFSASAYLFFKWTPKELVPSEDRGAFFVLVSGPEGASFSYMQNYMRKIENAMMGLVNKGEATRALSIMPRGFGKSDPVNSGFGIVVMKHWDKRARSTQQASRDVAAKLQKLPGVRAFPVLRMGLVRGLGQSVEFVIGGTDYQQLKQWRDIILAAARKNPNLLNVDSDYKETKPQLMVEIQRQRAAELGVSVEEIGKTLETMLGGRDVTTFIRKGEEYDVILESDLKLKKALVDLHNIYVRSKTTQQLIRLSNLVVVKEVTSPNALHRYNRVRAITISANLAKGYSLGEALQFLENTVKAKLPAVARIDYKGRSKEFKDALKEMLFTFSFAIVIMYLILAAQFGSFIHPFVMLLTVPLAMTGAFFGLWVTGDSLNIFSQIGIIMLIGLAAKNSILIIEFINQLREEGRKFIDAIIDGSAIRLRPVLMTALSTIFGAIPLIMATGAGAESRISIGVIIFFGVTFATFLTLYIIPVFYYLLAKKTKPRNYFEQKLYKLDRESD